MSFDFLIRLRRSLICLLLFAAAAAVNGQEEFDRRLLRVGIDLFPSLLAADRDLKAKTDTANELTVLLVHRDNPYLAEEARQSLDRIGRIGKYPLRVIVLEKGDLTEYAGSPPAAVFIVDRSFESLDKVVAFGRKHSRIVFSPYTEDLQRGVHGSVYLSDRILPELNTAALRDSRIRIKDFFLKVARVHED